MTLEEAVSQLHDLGLVVIGLSAVSYAIVTGLIGFYVAAKVMGK